MNTTYQFNGFLDYCLNKFNILNDNKLVDISYLKNQLLEICGKPLVLMINQKSSAGILKGNTAEARYIYFEKNFSESGLALTELFEKYPTIYSDVTRLFKSYELLLKIVQKRFHADRTELFKNGLLFMDDEELNSIKVKGDLHGGDAVLELHTTHKKLIYKPKTVANDSFFYNLLDFLNKLAPNSFEKFNSIKILDKVSYGWIEYVENSPLLSIEQAHSYYKRIGNLLAVSYIINLSDLHFENIVCTEEYPTIVDLETIFSVSLFQPNTINLATKKVNNKISNSVYSTGMLPILGNDKFFGGDTSGILGGNFTREERVIINPFRDDIRFKKKVVRHQFTGHIPYIMVSNDKEYCKPRNYLTDILNGFTSGYKCILDNKKMVLSYVMESTKNIFVRVLARNTLEYSVLIQAAKSPIYSQNRPKLFDKLKEHNSVLEKNLVASEIEQIQTLTIPYFLSNFHSPDVTDLNGKIVSKLPYSPFQNFLDQFENYSIKDMNEQKKLIEFSILSQEKLFIDGNEFINYTFRQGTKIDLEQAIHELKNIIENNAIISSIDNSINWMSIGVSAQDQILFESLDSDIYKGISGIGTALLEYYEVYPDENTKIILELIYMTISNSLSKQDTNQYTDFSFYNGLFGELAFLEKCQKILSFNTNLDIKHFYTEIIKMASYESDNLGDIISGKAGIIVYLSQINESLVNKKDIILLGEAWLKEISSELSMASYAHGNCGIMTALLYLFKLSNNNRFLEVFNKLWINLDSLKISNGWRDIRKSNEENSAYWCHGATGQALARIEWLKIDENRLLLSNDQHLTIHAELEELIEIILEKGINENNFCLCHGISGNLLVLDYYQKNFEPDNFILNKNVADNWYSIANFGINEGWICGLGTQFYSYGLMTGISGILSSLIKYNENKNNLGVLLPTV